jgi:hypothetical protein
MRIKTAPSPSPVLGGTPLVYDNPANPVKLASL